MEGNFAMEEFEQDRFRLIKIGFCMLGVAIILAAIISFYTKNTNRFGEGENDTLWDYDNPESFFSYFPYVLVKDYLNSELSENQKKFFTSIFFENSKSNKAILHGGEKLIDADSGFNTSGYDLYESGKEDNEEFFHYDVKTNKGIDTIILKVQYERECPDTSSYNSFAEALSKEGINHITDIQLVRRGQIRDRDGNEIPSWKQWIDEINFTLAIAYYCSPTYYDYYNKYNDTVPHKRKQVRENGLVTQNFIDKYGYDKDCFGNDSIITHLYVDKENSSWDDRYVTLNCDYGYQDKVVTYKVHFVLKDNKLDEVQNVGEN